MISRKVCLVLGAGVSCSYGFPSGRELWYLTSTQLGQRLDPMFSQLVGVGFQPGEVEDFGRKLAASQLGSIDRFIENNPDSSPIGRAAIATALIPFEDPASVIQPRK